MARLTQNHSTSSYSSSKLKWVFLTCCAALLGAALILDFLWASSSYSSSAYSIIGSSLALQKTATLVVLNVTANNAGQEKVVGDKRERANERLLSGTFADIAAPELPWEEMPPAPVHSHVDIFNFSDNTWGGRFDMPKEMGHSHLGVTSDGRYIYVISGQYGPQCRGPTARSFVLDTETKKWSSIPPLPSPRYAPATQLWRGRLHVMGGSKENRHTPGVEHWSIAVKDGKALEEKWRKEVPIPRGGPHRAAVVINDRLFVIGGQEGDFMAKPGSPIFKCSRMHEVLCCSN
ncbi:hypothetical protein ACLB2K_057765 [Fragaria x ananassa]